MLSVEVFSTKYLPLEAWPVQHRYAGRVLPRHHKGVIEKGFNMELDNRRERALYRHIMHEQVLNPHISVPSTCMSRNIETQHDGATNKAATGFGQRRSQGTRRPYYLYIWKGRGCQ
ncbi:hypothetical protein PIB30_004759 [Stylosanthes scabra]|uniref:Uncharacterized protein n=1 Tax=Stylosanthes scabra TaxID=79078 RepID=A0ABU6T4F4_9FABA|nr:hypothetical protein [Stylosanthes scabra]